MELEIIESRLFKKTKATCTEATYKGYLRHYKFVKNYLLSHNITNLVNLTFDDVLDFINGHKDLSLSPKTINHRLALIKMLLTTAIKSGMPKTYDTYQILDLKPLTVEPNSYMPLTNEQMNTFINYVLSLNDNKPKELKKKIMFLLCLQNGIRANELLEIKRNDLLLESNRIKLTHTKCHHVRYAYFDDYTKELMTRYVANHNKSEYLFYNALTLNRTQVANFNEIFRLVSSKLGFRVSSHMLRASFATMCLRNGCNIESVRIMMGHTNIRTTQMYLHMTDEEILQDNQEYNPYSYYIKKYSSNM